MKAKQNKFRVVLVALAGVCLGLVIANGIPAYAAPPASSGAPVQVVNTPLPVTGSVVVDAAAPLPVTGNVEVDGTVEVQGSVAVNNVPDVAPALPADPFWGRVSLSGSNKKATGVTGATLGVTSITLINFNTTPQQVFVYAPVFDDGTDCSAEPSGGSTPAMTLYVPPQSTLHMPFPTPLVFQSLGGRACVAGQVTTAQTGSVQLIVNGFAE